MIKDKKAMLLTEEVLKMVIAVIGLVLLSYFLVSFFYSDVKAKKQKEAISTIEKISQIISNMGISQGNVTALQPQRWTLFSFTGEEKKPNQCSGQNCICICNKVIGDFFDRQIKKCTKDGACLAISNLEEFEDIKIEPYTKKIVNINIQELRGKIQIKEI